jgi:BlaI family transcriptional regulator, penicillinase repressor
MANDDGRTPNDTEWALLEALWARGRGTAREVADDVRAEREWHVSTVKTLLDRMVKKELVRARRVGNVWEYEPAVEPVAARRAAWRTFLGAAFGGAMDPALRFIAEDAKLSAAERRKLRKLLGDDA